MRIELRDIGRRFGEQTIFSGITANFEQGEKWAILGGNGSGKSTLIKIIYGALMPSTGSVTHLKKEKALEGFALAQACSIAGPYLELIEELSVRDFLSTYQKFRSFCRGYQSEDILAMAKLEDAAGKSIRNLSSGMKQRLRLSLALGSASEVVLLDEPTSNLDPEGVDWYQKLLENELGGRTLLVGSNFSDTETFLCEPTLSLKQYK